MIWTREKYILPRTRPAPFMLSEGALFSIDHKIEINLFSWEVQIEIPASISKVNPSKDRFCSEVVYERKTKPPTASNTEQKENIDASM